MQRTSFLRRRFTRRPQTKALARAAPRRMPFRARAASRGMFGAQRITEVKSFDTFIPSGVTLLRVDQVVGTEPATMPWYGMTEINDVLKGDEFYQRIGSKINVRNVQVKFNIAFVKETEGGAPYPLAFRYMVVYDRQTNAAFPGIGTLLLDNDSGQTFYSSVNIPFKDRFQVLRDKTYIVDGVNTSIVPISEFIPGNFEATFADSTGSIGDMSTGSIYFICFQNIGSGAGITGHLEMNNFHSRIRYND